MSDRLLKVEGAGNDFVLGTGAWAERLAREPDLVRVLCDRHRGIGADGALAVAGEPGLVRLVYRNADGSEAAFCANGTRCAARAGVELLGLGSPLVVQTGWAALRAEVAGTEVTLELPAPTGAACRRDLETGAATWTGWTIEVGVPHLIVPVEAGLETLDLPAVAPPLRRHPALGPAGANVTFVEARGSGRAAVRSWERGVEGETLSCGSGVVAAALVWLERHGGDRLACTTRSGDVLVVVAPAGAEAVLLTGPARFVAEVTPLELPTGQ